MSWLQAKALVWAHTYREAIMTSDTSIRPVVNILVHKRCKQRNVFEKLVVQAIVLVEEGADAGHALQGGGAHETVAQRVEQRVREHSIQRSLDKRLVRQRGGAGKLIAADATWNWAT